MIDLFCEFEWEIFRFAGSEATICFSLPFVIQKEVGVEGAKPLEGVSNYQKQKYKRIKL